MGSLGPMPIGREDGVHQYVGRLLRRVGPACETPLGLFLFVILQTQGSRCAATLGYLIGSPLG